LAEIKQIFISCLISVSFQLWDRLNYICNFDITKARLGGHEMLSHRNWRQIQLWDTLVARNVA